MSPARVLLVAADPRVGTAIEHLVRSYGEVAGVLIPEDAGQALARLRDGQLRADVVLLDLGRRPEVGLELVAGMAQVVPVVVLGLDATHRDAAAAAGAAAFVPATAGPDELLDAVRSVLAQGTAATGGIPGT